MASEWFRWGVNLGSLDSLPLFCDVSQFLRVSLFIIIQWGIEMCGISWPDMSDVFIDYFLLAEQLYALGVEGQPQVFPVLHPVGLIWSVPIGEALAFWSTPPHWLSSEGAISPLSAIWGYFRSAHLADWQPHISCSVYNDSRVLLSHLSENS